jgi:hypothetical protein
MESLSSEAIAAKRGAIRVNKRSPAAGSIGKRLLEPILSGSRLKDESDVA